MDIKDIQRRLLEFVKKRGVLEFEKYEGKFELTTETTFIHLMEEVGEVARQLSNKKMRPQYYDEKNLKEEVVDVILIGLILAHTLDIDLEKDMSGKIDHLFKRHGIE